jgi:hypothetical protein
MRKNCHNHFQVLSQHFHEDAEKIYQRPQLSTLLSISPTVKLVVPAVSIITVMGIEMYGLKLLNYELTRSFLYKVIRKGYLFKKK